MKGQETLNIIAGLMGKPWTKEGWEAEIARRRAEKNMAKKDELSVAERLIALRKEEEELKSLVRQELEDELNAVIDKMDELGIDLPRSLINRVVDQYQPPAIVNRQAPLRTRNAEAGEKVMRTCKICGKTGHNARTCPEKGSVEGAIKDGGEPKLVKAEA